MFKPEDISLDTLLEAGAHFGHQIRRWNPKMDKYRHATKKGVFVFDLFKTRDEIVEALNQIEKAVSEKKSITLVGTKKQVKDQVKEVAEKAGVSYVNERWLGGTFSNFGQIRASIKKLGEMKANMESGEYEKLTKKERLEIQRDIDKMERKFGGIVNLEKKPDMMIIIDTQREKGAVKEAKEQNIATVGIIDSNANPNDVDFPIPMNDDSPDALKYILELIGQALTTKPAASAKATASQGKAKKAKKNE